MGERWCGNGVGRPWSEGRAERIAAREAREAAQADETPQPPPSKPSRLRDTPPAPKRDADLTDDAARDAGLTPSTYDAPVLPEPTGLVYRPCGCGCGELVAEHLGPRYANRAHQQRAYRQRTSNPDP